MQFALSVMPVGNFKIDAPKGFMSVDHVRQILDKISKEQKKGKRIFIDLYNWGEPTLHPDLASCIKAVHDFGFGCGISSNMNVFPNMREVVKAEPEYIRVSLSGFSNVVYKQTHRGGDINAVKGNMHLLRHYLDQYESKTVVQVGFHIYRSNFPDDFLKVRQLCDELEFIFAPVIATLMPAEKAVAAADGDIPAEDADINDKFVISLVRWKEIYREDGVYRADCQYRQARTTINCDGSVSLCCAVYDKDKTISEDFLKAEEKDLEKARYGHSFCSSCMSRSMHMMYTAVSTPGIEAEAARVLGPLYKQFQEEDSLIGRPDYIVWENELHPILEVYNIGLAALSLGEEGLSTAERCFETLVDEVPTFGEGIFQAARIAERRGNKDRALHLVEDAVRLAPGHALYAEELARLRREAQKTA